MAYSAVSVSWKAQKRSADSLLNELQQQPEQIEVHRSDRLGATQSVKVAKTDGEKHDRNVRSHPLRPPCDCQKLCTQKVPQLRRITIWEKFWNMDYNQRKATMWKLIKRTPTLNYTVSSRNWFVKYSLILENGEEVDVCKTFFLATFGYSKTSSVIQELLKTEASAMNISVDKRGKSSPAHAIMEGKAKLINDHIKSYNPRISHYRHEHAPRRLYLPHELTEKDMHVNYNQRHPDHQCSYMTYTRYVASQNIGFVKLG